MSKRPYDLPPLSAVAAFEAAARHASFKEAAGELNVTPPAVSRQVRNLERELGCKLFERLHRRVALTPEGRAFYDAVAEGFASMAGAAAAIRGASARQVRVGCSNAVATFWLMPRLKDFWERYPDVRLHHVLSDLPIDLAAQGVDLAIRFGEGDWPALDARLLYTDRIFPVASPGYVARVGRPADTAALSGQTLLDVVGVPGEGWLGWADWFHAVGARARPSAARQFNSYAVAVRAAIDGLGVVMGWESLVAGALADGTLVRVLGDEMQAPGGFFLVNRKGRDLTPEAQLFARWLRDAAATYRAGA